MSDAQQGACSLDALRLSGDWRVDPAGFHVLEAMARRLPAQQAPVRELLERKLGAALAAYAQRVAQRRALVDREAAAVLAAHPTLAAQVRRLQAVSNVAGLRRLADAAADAAPSPLARLNRELREAKPDDAAARRELASARRFRQSWERQRRLEQVEQAVARKPANPGPLNSHALVVQSLEWMRALSPDYLRHFVGYVETLQWLEDAGAKPREQPKAKKGAGRTRGTRAKVDGSAAAPRKPGP